MSTESLSGDRGRRLHHQDEAYALQKKGAIEGMIKYTVYTSLFVTLGHLTWPAFRKQAIGLKAFIISSSTLAGLVFGAEKYLLRYEHEQREGENELRRLARNELAKKGVIASETEIRKWRLERDAKLERLAARDAAAATEAVPSAA